MTENTRYERVVLAAVVWILAIAVSLAKYRNDEVNYYNSDAVWHTLYTIECYNETPIKQHLFLPIVSLGGTLDKYVPWGAAVSDESGNYYYTSFSPAGYFLPWLFFKIFHLAADEQSLYIFNSLLFGLSAMLWAHFLYEVYASHRAGRFIVLIGAAVYLFTPELFHGMGIVYWHQSVMQVTLLIQLTAYYHMKYKKSKTAGIIFYLMTLLNPYIEWTGYIANAGYALLEMILNRENQGLWNKIKGTAAISCFTILSFGIFSGHYLLRIDKQVFFSALRTRFLARSITSTVSAADIIGGYLRSFQYIWILVLILVAWNMIRDRQVECRHGVCWFIFSFVLIENFLMKQHASVYTYDRMKGIFLLSFAVCEFVSQILKYEKEQLTKRIMAVIAVVTLAVCGMNYRAYVNDESYIWETSYREENDRLAEYVTGKYPDAVYFFGSYIRGYMNLLFQRSIYEYTSFEDAVKYADEHGAAIIYIEYADTVNLSVTGVYQIAGACFYDPESGKTTEIRLKDGDIEENDVAASF